MQEKAFRDNIRFKGGDPNGGAVVASVLRGKKSIIHARGNILGGGKERRS